MIVEDTRPLYERDPAAYEEYLREGDRKQARKRVAADVLIQDGAGRVLLVKPSYKPGWDLPGGMVESDEAPHVAAQRELHEELGLAVDIFEPLVIDWVPAHGPWSDMLAFVFALAEPLTTEQIADLVPHDSEVERIGFFRRDEALELVSPRMARRLTQALDARGDGPRYVRDGRPLWAEEGPEAPQF